MPQGPGSLAGIWLNSEYKGSSSYPERERVLLTVDGKFPPMLPWAAELLEKRIKDSEAGFPFASTLALCLPGGIPLMLFGDDMPVQILETPGQVTMLFMEGNRFRVIPMDASHPEDVDPSFMGDAVGRWEGDTLVVDNMGFKDNTTLDQIGMPHTEQLHVVERYRRTARRRWRSASRSTIPARSPAVGSQGELQAGARRYADDRGCVREQSQSAR